MEVLALVECRLGAPIKLILFVLNIAERIESF